jgi:hypothetical protein
MSEKKIMKFAGVKIYVDSTNEKVDVKNDYDESS